MGELLYLIRVALRPFLPSFWISEALKALGLLGR